ncbi:MAG: hypothetical protein AAGI54_03775 [Planctomycetota bacterium]
MTRTQRELFLIAALVALLAFAAAWAVAAERRSAQRLVEARAQADGISRLAAEIADLKDRPVKVQGSAMPVERLAAGVESAAAAAGIDARRVVRIDPQPPRPIADRPYEIHHTAVQLQGVAFLQALAFLDAVETAADQPVIVTAVRLAAPRRDAADGWRLTATLSQTVYNPAARAAP